MQKKVICYTKIKQGIEQYVSTTLQTILCISVLLYQDILDSDLRHYDQCLNLHKLLSE